jgi:hypothetical protein
MKHLKHAYEALAKILENHCKHTQYPDRILTTYMCESASSPLVGFG